MEVILLENVVNLGQLGSQVKVAKGYGRNYLIPQGKAIAATKENRAQFEAKRAELEKAAKARLLAAQKLSEKINDLVLVVVSRAGEEGRLYGSVGVGELTKAFQSEGLEISKSQVRLPAGPLREVGVFTITVQLHAEVVVEAKVRIVPEE